MYVLFKAILWNISPNKWDSIQAFISMRGFIGVKYCKKPHPSSLQTVTLSPLLIENDHYLCLA